MKKLKSKNISNSIIYGKHPFFLTLKNRISDIKKIYTSNIKEIDDFIKNNNIKIPENIVFYKNNKELNEIPDNYKGFYTGGKAPKRLTYSISLGCSFIIKSGGDKKNG